MTHRHPALFDFGDFSGRSEEYVALIRQFAAAQAFRSATVDELVLDDDYHRRPLRPEDFDFLKFMKPVRSDNVSRLPSLASNRTLLSIYELDVARMPRSADPADWQRFTEFYRDDVKTLGAQLSPFLEAYAFSYLGNLTAGDEGVDAAAERLLRIFDDETAFWDQTFARLMRNDYLEEGLRFIMVQRWALAPSRRRAVAQALASGFFDGLPVDARPTIEGDLPDDELLKRIAGSCGVTRQQHAYWQFYLPTSMAKTNLLYALARRPDRAFALAGAVFAAEAEWLAFGVALERACAHLQPAHRRAGDVESRKHELVGRFANALRAIGERFGDAALAQCVKGAAAGEHLAERGRWDLGEQLKWLSAIPRFCDFARRISARIDVECPDIDRETFVEPHEMCSTTHVHNDHRLVTIQEGEMLFWGNLGMQLQMNEGDMVLIPDGRLHGSTVMSGVCTYHQPIIPDDWVQALVLELEAPKPARVAA
ncbi:peptide synthetase [Paraburkholderia sp.]|uniref:peptide synthetase n=1 Tax=Paraburkholderia sp. TaxID=1926495 RepID=UPI002399057D|nr:peptide synthetase [Paraburkholderia sp.]MDE1182645.1 peptide synthetase [Paraburkholderia sp.]